MESANRNAALWFLAGFGTSLLRQNLQPPGKLIEHEITPVGDVDSPDVIRSMGQLLGPPVIGGNRIRHLKNGNEIFPAMLEAIRKAQHSINFETFIYWKGEIGNELAEALAERARAGVEVQVLLDWVGSSRIDRSEIDCMEKAGVVIERYRPAKWYSLSRLNNRTHRKILVIDGRVGFTGGVGVADQWLGNAEDKDHWRDSHFEITGPAVAQLQSAFLDNWLSTHENVLHGPRYFPVLEDRGDSLSQVFKSSPEEGSGSVRLMYLYALAHAKNSVLIASAYFVPDDYVIEELERAVKRGLRVEVIVPGGEIDTEITRAASRAGWGKLLDAGIQIYEYQHTMFHCKYLVIDRKFVSVGSTNFDQRSFRLNDECNLNVFDPEFALEMEKTFEEDKARSILQTKEMWEKRPLVIKAADQMASLVASQT